MGITLCVTLVVLELRELHHQQSSFRARCDETARLRSRLVAEDVAGIVSTSRAAAEKAQRDGLRARVDGFDAVLDLLPVEPGERERVARRLVGFQWVKPGAPFYIALDASSRRVIASTPGIGPESVARALLAASDARDWRGEGFVAGGPATAPTLWYARSEPRLGWIIGAGESRGSATRAAQEAAVDLVDRLRFDAHGYAWIMRTDGRLVVNPYMAAEARVPSYQPSNTSGFTDPSGALVIDTMIDVCKRDGAGYVQYLWPLPGGKEPVEKSAYVKLIPEWSWIVVVSSYSDDIESLAKADSASLKRHIALQGTIAASLILLALALALVTSRKVSRKLLRTVESLQQFFRTAARGDGPAAPPGMPFTELAELAVLGNTIVSAQAAAEERWKRSEAQLHHAQRMESIGRLVGGVVHDFNNLLTAILGYADLIAGNPSLDPTGREGVVEIQKASQRAGSLTQQLLVFSRKQPAKRSIVDLNSVVKGVERMCSRIIGESITLETRLRAELSPVLVDGSQIEQVLINLVVNARDAIDGQGRITIETSPSGQGGSSRRGWVVLTVTDTGCGLSDEVKRHLFEPYYTTKGPGKGTGLGLSIISSIVHQSDGYIDVQSRLGAGTSFRIYFPCASEAESPKGAAGSDTRRGGRGETVLVVEDDPAVRGLIAAVLSSSGYIVLKAGSGADAFEILKRDEARSLRCLVVDAGLPDTSGAALLTRMGKEGWNVAVLYISGYPLGEIPAPSGSDEAFLAKPFTAAALLEGVRSAIDRGCTA